MQTAQLVSEASQVLALGADADGLPTDALKFTTVMVLEVRLFVILPSWDRRHTRISIEQNVEH